MKFLFVFLFLSCALAQTNPPSTSIPSDNSSDLTIRINVNLVQIDAVVTDSNNRPVTDLRAEDFEIFQDGVSQAITHCSYVHVTGVETDKNARVFAPPARELNPEKSTGLSLSWSTTWDSRSRA